VSIRVGVTVFASRTACLRNDTRVSCAHPLTGGNTCFLLPKSTWRVRRCQWSDRNERLNHYALEYKYLVIFVYNEPKNDQCKI